MPSSQPAAAPSMQSLAAGIRERFDRVLFVVAEGKALPENPENKVVPALSMQAALLPPTAAAPNPAASNPWPEYFWKAEKKLSVIAPVNYRKLPNMAYAVFSAPFEAVVGRKSHATLVQGELKPLLADCLALFDLTITSIEAVLPAEAADNHPQIQKAREYLTAIKAKRAAFSQDIDITQLLGLVDLFKNGAALIDTFPEFSNLAGIARQVAKNTPGSLVSGLAQPLMTVPIPTLAGLPLSAPLVGSFSLPLIPTLGEFSIDAFHVGAQGLPALIEGGLVVKDLYRTWSSVSALIDPAMALVSYFSGGGEYAPESLGVRLETYRLFSSLIRFEREAEQAETEFETLILNFLDNLKLVLNDKEANAKTSAETFIAALCSSTGAMVSGFATFGIGPIAGFLLSKTVTKCYEELAKGSRSISAKAVKVHQRPEALTAFRRSFREVLATSLINPSELTQFGLEKPEALLDPNQTPLSQSYFITPVLQYVEKRAAEYADPVSAAVQLGANQVDFDREEKEEVSDLLSIFADGAQQFTPEWIPDQTQNLVSASVAVARGISEWEGVLETIRTQEDPYYRDFTDAEEKEERKLSPAASAQEPVGRAALVFLFKQLVGQLNPILEERTGKKVSFQPIQLTSREEKMASALSFLKPLGAMEDAAISGAYRGLMGIVSAVKAPRQTAQQLPQQIKKGNPALKQKAKAIRELLENYEKVEPVPGDSLKRAWFPEFKPFNDRIETAETQLTAYTVSWNKTHPPANPPTAEELTAHPSPQTFQALLNAQKSYVIVYKQINEPLDDKPSIAAEVNQLLAEARQEKADINAILQAIPSITQKWEGILARLPNPDPNHLLANHYYNAQVSLWEKQLTRALFEQCKKSYTQSKDHLKLLIQQEFTQATKLDWIKPEGAALNEDSKATHQQFLHAFHQTENLASSKAVAAECRGFQKEIVDMGVDCLVEDTAEKFAALLTKITHSDEKSIDTAEKEISSFLQTIYQARLTQCPADSEFKKKLFAKIKEESGIDLNQYPGAEDSRLAPVGDAFNAVASGLGGVASAAAPSIAQAAVGIVADNLFGEGNGAKVQRAAKLAVRFAQHSGAQEAIVGQASAAFSQASAIFGGNQPSAYQTAVEFCLRDAVVARRVAALTAEKAEILRDLSGERENKPDITEKSERIKALAAEILTIGLTQYGAAQQLAKENLTNFSEILTAYRDVFLEPIKAEIQEFKPIEWIAPTGIDSAQINPQVHPKLLHFITVLDGFCKFPLTQALAASLKQEILSTGIAALKARLVLECTDLRTRIDGATEDGLKTLEDSLSTFVQKYTQTRDQCPATSASYGAGGTLLAYFKADFGISADCYGQEDFGLGGYTPYFLGGQGFKTALEASLRQALDNKKNQLISDCLIAEFKQLKKDIASADQVALEEKGEISARITAIATEFKAARDSCSEPDKTHYYSKTKFEMDEKVYGFEEHSLFSALNVFATWPAHETALEVELRARVENRRKESSIEVKMEKQPGLREVSVGEQQSPTLIIAEIAEIKAVPGQALAEREKQYPPSISIPSPQISEFLARRLDFSPPSSSQLQSPAIEASRLAAAPPPLDLQELQELQPVVVEDDVPVVPLSPNLTHRQGQKPIGSHFEEEKEEEVQSPVVAPSPFSLGEHEEQPLSPINEAKVEGHGEPNALPFLGIPDFSPLFSRPFPPAPVRQREPSLPIDVDLNNLPAQPPAGRGEEKEEQKIKAPVIVVLQEAKEEPSPVDAKRSSPAGGSAQRPASSTPPLDLEQPPHDLAITPLPPQQGQVSPNSESNPPQPVQGPPIAPPPSSQQAQENIPPAPSGQGEAQLRVLLQTQQPTPPSRVEVVVVVPAPQKNLTDKKSASQASKDFWFSFLMIGLLILVLAAAAGVVLPYFFATPTLLSFLVTGSLYATGGLALFLNAASFVVIGLLLLSLCALAAYGSAAGKRSGIPPIPSTPGEGNRAQSPELKTPDVPLLALPRPAASVQSPSAQARVNPPEHGV